jgi:hypothetical protein
MTHKHSCSQIIVSFRASEEGARWGRFLFWCQNCMVSSLWTVGWISADLRMRWTQEGEEPDMQLHESFNHDHASMFLVARTHTAVSFSRFLTLVGQLDRGMRVQAFWDVTQFRTVSVPDVSKNIRTRDPALTTLLPGLHQPDQQTASGHTNLWR